MILVWRACSVVQGLSVDAEDWWDLMPALWEMTLEWTDEFITHAQHELMALVKDWKYDYGIDDKACTAMLAWMILKLNPEADIDANRL